ncbi:hypothetical protein BT63DRAFT_437439 [Microthyrium microscopicum]|uniref:Hydrophobic surface binding protein A n=1 Tax=Microthyrium microscopicum TaxID=703497 RepID=A0A6A6UNI5_9PEZI|nr:hypothetical protein BT63DRAFT_437439 [Microthyrium microscopicum]
MQLKNLLVFTLAAGTYAQGAAIITGEMTSIGAALDTLDTAITGLTDANAATAAKDLVSKSEAVAKAITAATGKIGSAAEVPLTDAISISTAANTLTSKTDKTITDLIEKKAIIAKVNEVATVKTQLNNQKTAADALAKAIVSKLPAAAKSIGESQAGKISASIAKGVAAFN